MVIFHSYVSLPEGSMLLFLVFFPHRIHDIQKFQDTEAWIWRNWDLLSDVFSPKRALPSVCLWPLPGNCHPFVERWNCKEGTQISYKQMMRLNTKNSRMHVLKSPKYAFAQVECKEHCFFGGWSVQVIAESYYSKEVSKVSTCTWQQHSNEASFSHHEP